MSDKIEISVVVCTYNRSDVLALCLESLVNQTIDKKLFEVIIVNNNSTDDTEKIIKKFVDENNNFRLFIELEQGLSYSRNRGYKKATGKFIAYIDDDAIAFENWLEEMNNFINTHPEVKIFGGPYFGYSSKVLPLWLPRNYGTKNLGEETMVLQTGKEWISGTNMIFQKDILVQFNGFETSIGMIGNKISYGEETKIQNLLQENGIPVWYAPEVKVKHLTDEKKLKFSWIFKSGFNAGKVDEIVFKHKHNLIYYFALINFHILKYGIRLFNIKKFGENIYTLFHTLAYDFGILDSKIKGNN